MLHKNKACDNGKNSHPITPGELNANLLSFGENNVGTCINKQTTRLIYDQLLTQRKKVDTSPARAFITTTKELPLQSFINNP